MIIRHGWLEKKSDVSETIRVYFDLNDELTEKNQLVFKGSFLVVPATLRKEMMTAVHATHIGVEGCFRRTRDSLYWPRMTTELKECIAKCDISLSHQPCHVRSLSCSTNSSESLGIRLVKLCVRCQGAHC